MAQKVTNWVWQHSRSANAARIVLLAIAHESDADGVAEMSVKELSAKCRLSRRAVQMAVPELTSLGELAVRPKAGPHARNGYQVLMARGADSAPLRGAEYAPLASGVQNLRSAISAPLEVPSSQATRGECAESAPLRIDPHVFTTTGRSEVDVKHVAPSEVRSDVNRLCGHLADRVEANGSKRPVVTANWHKAARLLLDKDGRTEQQIHIAIDWCQDHEFWRANIMSMPKLREKYDQLRLQATRNGSNGRKPSTTDDRMRQAMDAAARVEQMLKGTAG